MDCPVIIRGGGGAVKWASHRETLYCPPYQQRQVKLWSVSKCPKNYDQATFINKQWQNTTPCQATYASSSQTPLSDWLYGHILTFDMFFVLFLFFLVLRERFIRQRYFCSILTCTGTCNVAPWRDARPLACKDVDIELEIKSYGENISIIIHTFHFRPPQFLPECRSCKSC